MAGKKIYVYAICKNESQFVKRWVNSMSEADGIYVLDTGSTDETVALLQKSGVHVTVEKISPWRFDVARNRSLELVPEDADLCVCTDLDELFHPGWRGKMEEALTVGTLRLKYRYTWNFLPDGKEGVVFWIEKAHARNGFRWVNPVHEVLQYTGALPYSCVAVEGIQLDHHADHNKSRGQYLPLLELAVKEDPNNDRNMHYLGREYMFHRMWPECEKTLKRHLALPSATWADERCASMRFLARAMVNQDRSQEAFFWLLRAVAEAPHLREPWLDTAEFLGRTKDWAGSLFFAEKALEIKERSLSYINEAASWSARPYDLVAVAAFYLKDYPKALEYGEKACEESPEDPRLKKNLDYYRNAIK